MRPFFVLTFLLLPCLAFSLVIVVGPALGEEEIDSDLRVGEGFFVQLVGAGNTVTTAGASSTHPNVGYQAGVAVVGMIPSEGDLRFGLDLETFYFNTGGGVPGSPTTQGVTLLAHLRGGIILAELLLPYWKVGLGYMWGSNDAYVPSGASGGAYSLSGLAISLGGGVQYYVTDSIYIVFDAAWVSHVIDDPFYNQVRYGAGIGFRFMP
jgi:hypothetical protein